MYIFIISVHGDIGLLNKSWNIIHMVDDKLVWDQHIDYISSKITCHIGILKCIRHFITKGITTVALPYLDCIVWEQCGEILKDRLQTLQNKTA